MRQAHLLIHSWLWPYEKSIIHLLMRKQAWRSQLGNMLNDKELASVRAELQTGGLSDPRASIINDWRETIGIQSSSFCTVFSPHRWPSSSSPRSILSLLRSLGRWALFTHLPTGYWSDLADGRGWEETGEQWGSEIRLFFLHSLPASVPCLWQWLCPFTTNAPARQAVIYRLQLSWGSHNTISLIWPRSGNDFPL